MYLEGDGVWGFAEGNICLRGLVSDRFLLCRQFAASWRVLTWQQQLFSVVLCLLEIEGMMIMLWHPTCSDCCVVKINTGEVVALSLKRFSSDVCVMYFLCLLVAIWSRSMSLLQSFARKWRYLEAPIAMEINIQLIRRFNGFLTFSSFDDQDSHPYVAWGTLGLAFWFICLVSFSSCSKCSLWRLFCVPLFARAVFACQDVAKIVDIST